MWAHRIRQVQVDDVWRPVGLAIFQVELFENGLDIRLQIDADVANICVASDAHAQ